MSLKGPARGGKKRQVTVTGKSNLWDLVDPFFFHFEADFCGGSDGDFHFVLDSCRL